MEYKEHITSNKTYLVHHTSGGGFQGEDETEHGYVYETNSLENVEEEINKLYLLKGGDNHFSVSVNTLTKKGFELFEAYQKQTNEAVLNLPNWDKYDNKNGYDFSDRSIMFPKRSGKKVLNKIMN